MWQLRHEPRLNNAINERLAVRPQHCMPATTLNEPVQVNIAMSASTANLAVAPNAPYALNVTDVLDDAKALELWAVAATSSVYNHPAWWRAAIVAFGPRRKLIVVQVLQNDQVVALLPFWRKRLGAREGLARIIEPVGARVTDYCLPLIHRDHHVPTMFTLLLHGAARHLDAQTLLLWPKVPIASASAPTFDAAAQDLGLLIGGRARPCFAMSLPGTYTELEQRWSQNHRGDVRRRIRRFSQLGKLELKRAGTRDEALAMLPRLFAMHIANWRARAGFSEFEAGPMPAFVQAITADLPLSLLHVSELRLNDIAIASHLGFQQGRNLLWYKPAFDIGWSNYAPGKVHVAMVAQQSIADGLNTLDFMQGEEPYKRLWSDLTTPTKSFAFARPIAYPMWVLNTRLRKFALEYRS
jgi:CelD/BcsL family acetyltransferase involved in cellulose biosynthesis